MSFVGGGFRGMDYGRLNGKYYFICCIYAKVQDIDWLTIILSEKLRIVTTLTNY